MKVESARVQSCTIIVMDEGETYIRHDADTWEWVVGMSTESVTDPTKHEEAYHQYLLDGCNKIKVEVFG